MPPHVGGAQEKSGKGHIKKISAGGAPHLQIASDATDSDEPKCWELKETDNDELIYKPCRLYSKVIYFTIF